MISARGLMRPQTPPPPRGPQTRATPPSPRTQRQPPATLPRNYNFQPPRLQQPRKMQAPPGSPGGKSKGLALFLKRQKKCTDADDEIQRFRDTDEPSRPAPSGPPVDLESKGRVEPTAAIKALRGTRATDACHPETGCYLYNIWRAMRRQTRGHASTLVCSASCYQC